MAPTVRELLTELAWIEDSIRHVRRSGGPPETANDAAWTSGLNPEPLALAKLEREIIDELRHNRSSATT